MTATTGKLLLDSNIIIYSTSPDHPTLAQFIEDHAPLASAISYVESLGFHRLTDRDRLLLERFFARARMLSIDGSVLHRAVLLRQQRKTSLGDSIVAATALVHDLTLVTRNVDDFRWIAGLRLLNPFDSLPARPLTPPVPPADGSR